MRFRNIGCRNQLNSKDKYNTLFVGTSVDDYTAEAMMYHQKFRVPPNKMTGWKRLVGQELPVEAYSDLMSIASKSNYSSQITDLRDVQGNTAAGAPASSSVTARKVLQVVSGPQTPKLVQPILDLWVPLTRTACAV
jgi:hypothetical protein